MTLRSSDAGQTQRGVGAPEPEGVGEGHAPARGPPLLGPAGDVVQGELRLRAVQVECGRQDAVVTGHGGEGGLQGPGGPQEVAGGPLDRGHGHAAAVLPEQTTQRRVLRGVPQRRGGGVGVDVRHVRGQQAGVPEGGGHGPEGGGGTL